MFTVTLEVTTIFPVSGVGVGVIGSSFLQEETVSARIAVSIVKCIYFIFRFFRFCLCKCIGDFRKGVYLKTNFMLSNRKV